MYKDYIITYWTGKGKKAKYRIKAQFEQDARVAFFWDIEMVDENAKFISIEQVGKE